MFLKRLRFRRAMKYAAMTPGLLAWEPRSAASGVVRPGAASRASPVRGVRAYSLNTRIALSVPTIDMVTSR